MCMKRKMETAVSAPLTSHTQVPFRSGMRSLEARVRKNNTPESPTSPTPAPLPVLFLSGRDTPLIGHYQPRGTGTRGGRWRPHPARLRTRHKTAPSEPEDGLWTRLSPDYRPRLRTRPN